MSDPRRVLLEAVRKACSPGLWSRGVELVRAGAVVVETEDDEEAIFRISTRGGMIAPRVNLFLDDGDWECGCSSRQPACEHVCAAVIAWSQTDEQGQGPARSTLEAGRVEYLFERSPDERLNLRRVIVRGERIYPLETTLASIASRRVDGPAFVASQTDLAVELALGTHRRGALPRQLVPRLFARLANCEAIRLDGRAVRVSAKPLLPRVLVEEQGDGFRLSLADASGLDELFHNGIALTGELLQPVGELGLNRREYEQLTAGRHIPPGEVALLVGDLLPSLRRRLPVEVRTTRLPGTVREAPRVRIDTTRDGERLGVLASIVYGHPPIARVDGAQLSLLGDAVPERDHDGERRLTSRLQQRLGLTPGIRRGFVGEDAVTFRAQLLAWEPNLRGTAHEAFRLAPPLRADVKLDGDRLEVAFESRPAESVGGRHPTVGGTAAPDAVLSAWRRGASLVPLLDGAGWAPLPTAWLSRFGDRLADLLDARDSTGRVPRACLTDLLELYEKLEHPAPAELTALNRRLADFDKIPTTELPADLATELRGYQREGVDWLVFLREAGLGALLADDMGLGKTLQALCAVRGRTLVVAPTSVLHNWAAEIERHRPALTTAIFHGPQRQLEPEADLTLTTYAILRLDADRLSAVAWDTVVLDEAQAIKNPESQVADAAFRLQADFRLALTGTPVENRLDELWSQFHFINRGLLGGRSGFRERYADPIANGEPGIAERMRRRIKPFLLRRLKQDVAPELPPRTEVVLRCQLDQAEQEVYDTVRAATVPGLLERLQSTGNLIAALEALLRLRQASCHAALVPGQQANGSSKLRLLLGTLDSVVAEEHKALVFSQWTTLLDLVEPHLRDARIPFVRLDGSTRDRASVVARFQSDDGPPVLLISLRAGGTGLNLTAADHVFLLDPWWNPAVEDQAADRAHRIGQVRPVIIHRLVAEGTVEERILELQQSKRGLAAAALGEADQAGGLTREDLMELLR